jgi:hypothetical protein
LVKPELDDLARKYEYVQNIFEVTFQIFLNRFVNEIFGNLFYETFGSRRYFF